MEKLLTKTPLAEPARAAFRARLREEFLSAQADRLPSLQGSRAGTGPSRPARGRSGNLQRLVLVGLAAAAAIFVTFVLPGEPTWRVNSLRGQGPLEVAGISLDQDDAARLGFELARGAVLSTFDNTVDLSVDGGLELRVLPGTEVSLAQLPESGTVEPYRFDLARGEVYIQTTATYAGNPILIDSDEVHVTVTGTTLGVLRDDRGTCVCVAEGGVDVHAQDEQAELDRRVTSGASYLVFRGGAMPPKELLFVENDPQYRAHTVPLEDFLHRP